MLFNHLLLLSYSKKAIGRARYFASPIIWILSVYFNQVGSEHHYCWIISLYYDVILPVEDNQYGQGAALVKNAYCLHLLITEAHRRSWAGQAKNNLINKLFVCCFQYRILYWFLVHSVGRLHDVIVVDGRPKF